MYVWYVLLNSTYLLTYLLTWTANLIYLKHWVIKNTEFIFGTTFLNELVVSASKHDLGGIAVSDIDLAAASVGTENLSNAVNKMRNTDRVYG